MNTVLNRLQEIASAVMYASEGETLSEVFKRIADVSRELVDARYAALGIPDEKGGLKHFAVSGMDDDAIRRIGAPPSGHGLLGLMMSEHKPMRVEAIHAHKHSVGFPPGHPPMNTYLGVPIRLGDRLYGMIYLCDRVDGKPFTDKDQNLIEMLAGYAALAIVNSQARQQEKRLALLEERERISMELHDGVIQSLYAVGMQVELLRTAGHPPGDGEFKQVLYSVDHIIEDIRTYIQDLARRSSQQKSIRECLSEVVERLCVPASLQVHINAPYHPLAISPVVLEAACQMTHEAVSNVLRHAEARVLDLSAAHYGNIFQVCIADNGRGFSQKSLNHHHGLGLHNMEQRARLHGGTVEVVSVPGEGTQVTISLPLNGK
jgi:signal transduction histidine kinase